MDPATLASVLSPVRLTDVAQAVGLAVKGIGIESVEGPLGRFDDDHDEADIDKTLELVARMETIADLKSMS